MKFHETELADARLIEPERHADDRGYFARVACVAEFAAAGIEADYPQASVSHNARAGTLRGMHFQRDPYAEAKVVRVTRGALFDVIIDLRPASPTFRRWQGFELSAENGRMLYIPKGFAHGFLTLEDETDMLYLITPAFVPGHGDGVRFDDPAFAIDWPREITVIAAKDREWPLFKG